MVPPKSNCTLPLLPIRISIAPSLILTQDQKILLCGGYRNFQKCLGLNKDAWQEHSSLNEKRRYAVSFTMHSVEIAVQYFSIILILREINFGGYKNSKNAVFALLGALNF